MREPKTPEEWMIQRLTAEWEKRAGKVFRPSESYFVHVPNGKHFFVSLERLGPIIDSLDILPILNTYRLSNRHLKDLRSDRTKRSTPTTYIQFGEVRVEGFPHWEPIVASFCLVPVLVQEKKNELDRRIFIKDKSSNSQDSDYAKSSDGDLDQDIARARAELTNATDVSGFLYFKESGLLLEKLSLLEHVF